MGIDAWREMVLDRDRWREVVLAAMTLRELNKSEEEKEEEDT
jgi:hypothetical protein